MKPTIICSFSGGRTSAYMTFLVNTRLSKLFKVYNVFANTGQEHDKTLEFVNRCDKEWGLNLTWLEAVVRPGRKGTTYKVVDFNSATRDGSLFEAMCEKYGLPNKSFPHCTRELKLQPMRKWRDQNISKFALFAVGIRMDEIDRISTQSDVNGVTYPLVTYFPSTKEDVMRFWEKQPFDLDLPEHLGNCLWCWKKSDKKLGMVAEYDKRIFTVPSQLEQKYQWTNELLEPRKMFRLNRNVSELFSTLNVDDDTTNGCSDHCEVM